MKKYLLILFAFLFAMGFTREALAQTTTVCEQFNFTEMSSGINRVGTCAPVNVEIWGRYTFSSPVADPSKVKMKFYLNDGEAAPVTVQAVVPDPAKPNTYYASVKHDYDQGQDCNFTAFIYIVYDGVLCDGTEKAESFHIWNTDDKNPEKFTMEPVVAEFCPETPIVGHKFKDATAFNCNITLTNTNPNRDSRWVQFIYNTEHTNGSLIKNVEVEGTMLTDGNGDFLNELNGPIVKMPFPADIPNQETFAINAPAGSPIGSYFEVTMRNWNVCNPYDDPNIPGTPADPINGDNPPIVTTARMLIVAPPEPVIITHDKNDDPSVNFCPLEDVRFIGSNNAQTVGANYTYKWEIYNDAAGTTAELLYESTSPNFWLEGGFPEAGTKMVKLKIQRTATTAACWSEETYTVNVYDAPVADGEINGVATNVLEVCFDKENPNSNIKYTFDLYSENKYSYTYKLFKRNSSSSTPDSTVLPTQNVAAKASATATYDAVYNKPGEYRTLLEAIDEITGCETTKESKVIIYDTPVASFTFDNLCVGQATKFKDSSTLGTAINGDKIISWAWDFTNDGVVDETTQNPSFTYSSAGTYEVALEVETQGGCKHKVVKQIEVYPVPEASLGYDYTAPICPGEPVVFENLSLINNTATLFPDGVAYTLLVSDGADTLEVAFMEDTYTYSFENTSSATLTYNIWIKAKAGTSNCESLSTPLQVEVKPGAKADFYEPKYNPIATNCAPVDLDFVVNQATLNLNATSHTWIIKADGQELLNKTFSPGEEGYDTLSYTALNTNSARLLYEVTLIAKKDGTCIQPAVHNYQVAPVPAAEDFPLTIEESCDTTLVHIKVADMAGIINLHWNISPQPANHASVNYDDEFTLIYLRPGRSDPAFQVEMSLVKENYFGCQSEPTDKQVNINTQVIDDVELHLLSTEAEGCSPLTATFGNTTNAPAGTTFELYIKHGTADWQVASLASAEIDDNFSYTFTAPGSYIVRLKATLDGCSRFSPSTINLVVYDDPQPNFDLDVKEGCSPLSASFIKNIHNSSSNTWTITDLSTGEVVYKPSPGVDTISSYLFNNSGNTIKKYQVLLQSVSDKTCEADSVLEVKVYPAAAASFNLLNADACAPYEVVVENTSQNPTGTTYTWNWDDGSTTTSNDTELRHTYTNGSFSSPVYKNITLTATTPDGCTSIEQEQLTLQPQVLADFVTDKAEGCSPLNVYFTNRSKGNSSTESGWYIREAGAAGFTAMGASLFSHQFENEGDMALVYEVLYVAKSTGGCSDSLSREITVHPQVQPAIAQDAAIGCGPLEVSFTNNNPEAREIYIWDWADGSDRDTTRYQQTSLTHVFENASTSSVRTYRVQVQVIDTVSNCSSIIYQEVAVQPGVVADVVPSATEGCAPLQIYFQNYSRGANSHSWEVINTSTGATFHQENNSFPTIPDLTNNTNQPVVYQVRYVALNTATGCSDEQLTDITVKPGTEALFELDYSTVCANTEVVFTNLNIQPGVQYIWRWNDGEPNDTTTSETTLTHTFVNTSTTRAKQFEVELIAYNPASGCPSSYKQSVMVNPVIDLQVSPDNSKGCAPLLVNFSNQSKNVATHRWFVREQGSSEKAQEQAVAEPQFTLDNQGGAVKLYEVVYIGTSAQGCADSTINTIQVYPQLQPAFTTDSIRVRLPNSTFQIENETPHAGAWTYNWDFGDGNSSTAVHPGAHTYETYGEYTITLTISNGLCSESYSQDVKVNEILPIVDFESIPVSGCGPLTVQFKNNSKYADPETFFWDFGDGEGYSSGVNPTYTYYKPGEYTVTLTASNPTGEVVSTSYAIVTVHGKPKIDFEIRESVVYVPGEPLYVANYTIGGSEYIWNFGDGTEYREFEPVHYYKEPGIYTITLTAINEWGCADSLVREGVVTAIAGGEAKIPNAFTPNSGGPNGGDVGAGNNDVFYPVLEGGVTRYNLKIYNRWGEMLFESNNRQTGWDGYYKGSLSKADVYVYKLSVEFSDGRTMEKLGDLTLIR